MAEFKNGDRVRFTRANPCGGAIYGQNGEEAVVIDALLAGDHATHGKLVRVQRDSGGFNPIVPVSALALVSAADTRPDAGGGFKAGDRIRFVSPFNESKGCHVGDIFVAVACKGRHAEHSVHYTAKDGSLTWRPGVYFELVTEAAGSDDDADRWNAKALREEYRERLSTLTLTELPQFINDLLSEKIDKNVANSVVGLIASASSKVIRDKLKGA
jgi:hypothetical protein